MVESLTDQSLAGELTVYQRKISREIGPARRGPIDLQLHWITIR